MTPLTGLTNEGTTFLWNEETEATFQALKDAFTYALILKHFEPEQPIMVETDAYSYVSVGVMSEYDKQGILQPVTFCFKKHFAAECNCETYDKEQLAVIRCFEEWHSHHRSSDTLEYFMSTKLLNRRQGCWSEFLSRFNFQIQYRPG